MLSLVVFKTAAPHSLAVSVHASMFTLLIRSKSVAWKGLMMDILVLDDDIPLAVRCCHYALHETKYNM